MQRILVTGGAGFIGSHLAEVYVEQGNEITVVDNLATGSVDNLAAVFDDIVFLEADILNILEQDIINLEYFDLVVHLAGNGYVPPSVENPPFDFHANLETTFLILERMRKADSTPRFVYASTAAVYGNPIRVPIVETDPTVPISPYGVSKLASERYLAVYSQLFGLPAVSLRFFSVYGPRLRKQVVFDLFGKLSCDPNRLEVLGNGMQERDFIYVRDLVNAILVVAENAPMRGETYNIASGSSVTIRELVGKICDATGLQPKVDFTGSVRPGDAERWIVDISKLAALGYSAQVDLVSGLKATYEWHQTLSELV